MRKTSAARRGCWTDGALGLRLRSCLAGVGAGAYLALVALGAERIVARADACTGCAWGALAPRIEAQAQQAQQVLQRLGPSQTVTAHSAAAGKRRNQSCVGHAEPAAEPARLVPPAVAVGQVAAARAMTAGEASGAARMPGRDRRRAAQAGAYFSSDR